MPFYHVKHRFWIPALVIMSFALLILIFPILGWPVYKWHDLDEESQAQTVQEPKNATYQNKKPNSDEHWGPCHHVSDIDYDIGLDPIEVARAFHTPSFDRD